MATPKRGTTETAWREVLTLAEAAEYCGYKDAEGLRKARQRGRVRALGRRGGTGTWMFRREDLDQFISGRADESLHDEAVPRDLAPERAHDGEPGNVRDARARRRRVPGDSSVDADLKRLRELRPLERRDGK